MDKLVVFALADRTCALPRATVRELLPVPRLWQPPGTPDLMAGFLNLGGDPMPVIWLARVFGLPTAPAPPLYAHILVLKAESRRTLALLVDRVLDVAIITPDQVRPVAHDASLNGCIAGEIQLGDGLLHLLDADRILLAEEQQRLAELAQAVQRRMGDWPATT
jgi:purine-binding chemotaxis protein CheW